MFASPSHPDCDVFCHVVDNFGDIGVCWRLARQLHGEYGLGVRLWVDDLVAFGRLASNLDPEAEHQDLDGIEVRRWQSDFVGVRPATLVVETFACHLPDTFVEAMAAADPKPVWINLDYLSAEDWVAGCHTLPSPHPRLPLTKYFFFPGFDERTGGLLRESDLSSRRRAFLDDPAAQAAFRTRIGLETPAAGAKLVSLFAYADAPLDELCSAWATGGDEVVAVLPEGALLPAAEAFAGRALRAGDQFRQGRLELAVIPFLDHGDYDRLLWSCDLNFVRGEDSFVRAQWAARPFVWQIYPQAEDTHRVKLAAFLDRYTAGLSVDATSALGEAHDRWNGAAKGPAFWGRLAANLPELREHAGRWAGELENMQDLCSALMRFFRSKV